MSADWEVIQREIQDDLRSGRALAVFLVALLFFAVAFWQGHARVATEQRALTTALDANWGGWLAQGSQHPHAAAHYPMLIAKPPAPLGGLTAGIDGVLGRYVFTDAHRVLPVNGAASGEQPLVEAIGGLDALFVVGVVLPLLAVLAGAGAVAEEKERGTLRLVLATVPDRRRWLFMKLAGRYLTLAGALSAGAGLAWLVAGGVPIGEGGGARLAAVVATSALYLAVWLGAGGLCSVLAPRLAHAVLAGVALWVGLVVVVPRVLATAVEAVSPPPSAAPARMATMVSAVTFRREQERLVAAARAAGKGAATNDIVKNEGSAAIRALIDGKAARALAESEAPLVAWRETQLARLDVLSFVTPLALYVQVATSFAGADHARHADFLGQAETYRQGFLGELHRLEDGGASVYADHAKMDRFAFREATAGDTGWRERFRIGGLLALALGLLAATLSLFGRYDAR